MVAIEGIGQGTESEPSMQYLLAYIHSPVQFFLIALPGAKSLSDVASEPTNIGSDHGNLVKTGHLQNLRDREAVLEPLGEVVYDTNVSNHFREFP